MAWVGGLLALKIKNLLFYKTKKNVSELIHLNWSDKTALRSCYTYARVSCFGSETRKKVKCCLSASESKWKK